MGPCRDSPQARRPHDIPLRNKAYNPKFGPFGFKFERLEKFRNPKGGAPSLYSSISRRSVFRPSPEAVPAVYDGLRPF